MILKDIKSCILSKILETIETANNEIRPALHLYPAGCRL